MSANTQNNPIAKEYQDPNKVTRMIILGPKAEVGDTELVHKLHLLGLPLTIKSTCYGALIYGEKEDVDTAIEYLREIDPYNIFTKDRGFPPGDPRRCQGHRGGPREGFHQLEKEFLILADVAEALKNPEEVSLEKESKIPVTELRQVIEKETGSKLRKTFKQ